MKTLEKNHEFQTALKSIGSKRTDFLIEEAAVWREYNDAIKNFRELQSIGETDAAEQYRPTIARLSERIDLIKSELELIGNDADELFSVIAKHPESKLHKLAFEVQQSAIEEITELKNDIPALETELEAAKAEYLRIVEKLGASYRAWAEIYVAGKRAERMLSEDEQSIAPLRPRNMPGWASFEISEDEISAAYGTSSYIGGGL